MYTENDIVNVANTTIKMFDNLKEQITLVQTSYLKQIETLIEAKRKEAEENSEPISEEEFLKTKKNK
jgi:hypothetical protein